MWRGLSVLIPVVCWMSVCGQRLQRPVIQLDVISIKENRSGEDKGYVDIPPEGNRITVRNTPMFRIIGFAFNKQRNDLIEGLPDWTRDVRWDIEATVAEGSISIFRSMPFEEKKEVIQQILAERCQLSAHTGVEKVPVFALKISKSGMRMKASAEDKAKSPSDRSAPASGWDISQSSGRIVARGLPLEGLIYALSKIGLSRPVVDRTGLAGRYDISLVWTMDESAEHVPGGGSLDVAEVSIFSALEDQLGLKLEATRANVPAVIVTRLERPSAN